ncbi:hypothetical protein [Inconstantimicrobium mannanitabidum]|uniref:Uncharacterized protein n=1 Tax=Inconstantimicrobium mannanitabidum TaxID=1604901 RepID=A0ACB5R7Y4_9CLOT|nr:hypothetical protein [Clostridium sp. TW13]GKX65292.1 hypothetical protein rsdtw13_05500 [Clostridium sp. TW13]
MEIIIDKVSKKTSKHINTANKNSKVSFSEYLKRDSMHYDKDFKISMDKDHEKQVKSTKKAQNVLSLIKLLEGQKAKYEYLFSVTHNKSYYNKINSLEIQIRDLKSQIGSAIS